MEKIQKYSKYFFVISLVIIVHIVIFTRVNSSTVTVVNKHYDHKKLENETEYTIIENHTLPIVNLAVTHKLDVREQNINQLGINHLIEHLIVADVRAEVEKIGGVINGMTSEDYIILYITVPNENWQEGLQLINRMCNYEILSEKNFEIEEEIKIVLEEKKYTEQETEKKLWDMICENLMGDKAYQLNVLGNAETLDNITNSDIKERMRKIFTSDNRYLVIGGDIDALEVENEVSELFKADYHQTEDDFDEVIDEVSIENKWVFYEEELNSDYAIMIVAWDGPQFNYSAEHSYQADVLCKIINCDSNLSSLINQDGIITRYQAYFSPGKENASFFIRAVVRKDDIEKAKQVLLSAVTSIENYNKISTSTINGCKQQLINEWYWAQENILDTSLLISRVWASVNVDYMNEYAEEVKDVTLDSVIEIADEYICSKPFVGGYINDVETTDTKNGEEK